jgi:hypothetical protein
MLGPATGKNAPVDVRLIVLSSGSRWSETDVPRIPEVVARFWLSSRLRGNKVARERLPWQESRWLRSLVELGTRSFAFINTHLPIAVPHLSTPKPPFHAGAGGARNWAMSIRISFIEPFAATVEPQSEHAGEPAPASIRTRRQSVTFWHARCTWRLMNLPTLQHGLDQTPGHHRPNTRGRIRAPENREPEFLC